MFASYPNVQPNSIVGEIEFSKYGVFYFTNKNFLIIQYAKIQSLDEDVIYNFNLYSKEVYNGEFQLNGYVVEINAISQLKIDNTVKPSSQKFNGYYDNQMQMRFIHFPKEQIYLNPKKILFVNHNINNIK